VQQVGIRRGPQPETVFATGTAFSQLVKPGAAYTLRSGGGGGFGKPTDRKLEDVENDVRQGYVSIAAAKAQYGVVIDQATMKADREATAALRADMKARGLPQEVPLTSQAVPSDEWRVVRLGPARGSLGKKARAWQAEAQAEGLLADRCCS